MITPDDEYRDALDRAVHKIRALEHQLSLAIVAMYVMIVLMVIIVFS